MADHILMREVKITTTGGAGVANGEGIISDVRGFLLAIYLNWHASAPATSVPTIKYRNPGMGNILVAPAGNIDTLYEPRKEICTESGVATGLYDYFPLAGELEIEVATCNALTDALVATLIYASY